MWAKSNNRTRGQFECDVLGFAFVLISFVHMHGAAVVPQFVGYGGGGGGGGGVRLKLDVQGQGGGKNLDVDGQGVGGGGLEN